MVLKMRPPCWRTWGSTRSVRQAFKAAKVAVSWSAMIRLYPATSAARIAARCRFIAPSRAVSRDDSIPCADQEGEPRCVQLHLSRARLKKIKQEESRTRAGYGDR